MAACLGLTAVLPALTVVPPTFHQLVTDAGEIYRVQVTAVNARWDDSPSGRVIHTYVEAKVLRNLKGTAGETVTLRFLGGAVDGQRLRIADMPELKVGASYVVFVAENGQAFCPLVGVMFGDFPIVKDPGTGVERVLRSNGSVLRSVAAVTEPMGEPAASPGEPGTVTAAAVHDALTVEAFETAIRGELSASVGHATQTQ